MESRRQAIRNILSRDLRALLQGVEPPSAPDGAEGAAALAEAREGGPALCATVAALEAAAWSGASPDGKNYIARVNCARLALSKPLGVFPDDLAAARLVRGLLAPEAAISLGAETKGPSEDQRCKREAQALFVRALRRTPEFAADRALTEKTARKLMGSSVEAAIAACRDTDSPHTPSWASPAFVEIFSARCGVIYRLLDPTSASCRAYGTVLASRLLSGALQPEAVGGMSEASLCPPALAAEQADIARRSSQRVKPKESAMFRCPHCKARRCTYQQVQRRAIDEAADFVCFCLDCGRKFQGRT